MTVIYGLLLQAKGEVKRIKLCDTKESTTLTPDSLQTILKKKTPVQELGVYEYGDYVLTLFGYTSGKAGTENKHELPPPLNERTIYSDILLIASKAKYSWAQPIPFTPDQYEKFYAAAFGGNGEDEEESDSDSNSILSKEDTDEEKEDDDEPIIQSAKKKAAVEDGVPEDEDDEEPEDDDEIDSDEEGEDEEQDEIEGGGSEGGEYDEPVPKQRASSKKKVAKGNTTVVQNTGRAKQQALHLRPGFQEITQTGPIPTQDCMERQYRQHTLGLLRERFPTQFTEEEHIAIERAILSNTMVDADAKFVLKHFDNTLFQVCYTSATRRLLANLDPSSYVKNEHLFQKLTKHDLQIEHLATMNVMDYAPNLYSGLHDRMLLREQQQLEGNKAMATDAFKCNRCGKRETTFYELQTRSADEPMTKFITCVNCGKRWRM
jgi:DNA-directed RNA polymerase subunit M/transcription elongation factor TFIIS